MNYGTLTTLNDILKNLQSDIATIAFSIAGIMMVVCIMLIMFDTDTNVAAHGKRWETLRRMFVCVILLSAAGAIILFGQQLGKAIHA